jgi:hypothetical protein
MKEFKGTRGKVFKEKLSNLSNGWINIKIENATITIYPYNGRKDKTITNANANLIVDAFKVRQSINCELSELLEQRNEMLTMLKRVSVNYDKGTQTYLDMQQLIKKVKHNG